MKRLAAVLLLFIGSNALASDWQIVSSGDHVKSFIDRASIARSGRYKKAWVQYSYEGYQNGNAYSGYKNFRSTKQLEYFDCDERTSAILQTTYYTDELGSGEYLGGMSSKLPQASFSEVVPDTMGEVMLNFVCKPIAEKPSSAARDRARL